MTLDDPQTNIPIFVSCDAMLARYILCYSPVLVRPSVLLGAEGPRDANSCRGTRVATSSYMIGPSMRPIAIGAAIEQPGGQRTGSALLF